MAISGENGIIQRAVEAREETEKAEKIEQNTLNSYEDTINEYMGIDWDRVLENAEKHPDQKTSTAIGVGTDGRAVNMDLWECIKLEDGTYALNDAITLEETGTKTAGYIGDIVNGKIEGTIPQYIKDESDGSFVEVTSLRSLFYGISDLTEAPVIPSTVTSLYETFQNTGLNKMVEIPNGVLDMTSTFYGCSNLEELKDIPDTVTNLNYCFAMCTSIIDVNIKFGKNITDMRLTFQNCSNLVSINRLPKNVINLQGTFRSCTSLKIAPIIPDSVTDMKTTFYGCTSLTTVSNLPDSLENLSYTFQNCSSLITIGNIPNCVTNMQGAFFGCTSLTTVPDIPDSVTNMRDTFLGCTNLQGNITINANLTGALIEGYKDYQGIFWNACTTEGITLKLVGSCSVLQEIVKSANNPNITLGELT